MDLIMDKLKYKDLKKDKSLDGDDINLILCTQDIVSFIINTNRKKTRKIDCSTFEETRIIRGKTRKDKKDFKKWENNHFAELEKRWCSQIYWKAMTGLNNQF